MGGTRKRNRKVQLSSEPPIVPRLVSGLSIRSSGLNSSDITFENPFYGTRQSRGLWWELGQEAWMWVWLYWQSSLLGQCPSPLPTSRTASVPWGCWARSTRSSIIVFLSEPLSIKGAHLSIYFIGSLLPTSWTCEFIMDSMSGETEIKVHV